MMKRNNMEKFKEVFNLLKNSDDEDDMKKYAKECIEILNNEIDKYYKSINDFKYDSENIKDFIISFGYYFQTIDEYAHDFNNEMNSDKFTKFNFKDDFDSMIKSIISASKSHGNRFEMLFDNSPENIIDVN